MTEDTCCCLTIFLIIGFLGVGLYENERKNQLNINPISTQIPLNLEERTMSKKRKKEIIRHRSHTFPKQWFDLKEIYPNAEIYEYADYDNYSSGNWDIEGIKQDLRIVSERTGKNPTGRLSDWMDQSGAEINFKSMTKTELKKTILSLTIAELKDLLRKRSLPVTGVKSKLIARLMDAVQKEKSHEARNNKSPVNKQNKKDDTTTIECPDCSTAINIPNTQGLQKVKCPKCKIEGEIEL